MTSILVEITWQDFPESKEIDLKRFIKDAEGLIRVIESLGSSSTKPIRSDMVGNIKKITDSYAKNCPEVQYLHEILEFEISNGLNKKDPSASIGLLWLKRGMEYFFEFLSIMCEGLEDGSLPENMTDVVKRSYELSLKPHHNWLMNKTFSMVSYLTPTKTNLLKNLTQDDPTLLENLPKDMRSLLDSMQPILEQVNELISKYGIGK